MMSATTLTSSPTDSNSVGTEAQGFPTQTQQLLRFAVGQSSYAIVIDDVRELIEAPTMISLPLMPDFVRGVINLRGAVVPIIDLAARLGRPCSVLTRRSCIVVVDVCDQSGSAQKLGMLVDGVHEVITVMTHEIEVAPSLGTQVPAEYLSGMARVRQHVIEVLALHKVLDIEVLAELISNHHAVH